MSGKTVFAPQASRNPRRRRRSLTGGRRGRAASLALYLSLGLVACETWLVGVAPLVPTSGNASTTNVNQTEYVAGQTAATYPNGSQPAGPALGLTDPTGAVESGIVPLATPGSNGKGNGGGNGGGGRQPGGGTGPTDSPFSGFGSPNPSGTPLVTPPPTDTPVPTPVPTDTPAPTDTPVPTPVPTPPPTDTPAPTAT